MHYVFVLFLQEAINPLLEGYEIFKLHHMTMVFAEMVWSFTCFPLRGFGKKKAIFHHGMQVWMLVK